jgi:hypothetical protein
MWSHDPRTDDGRLGNGVRAALSRAGLCILVSLSLAVWLPPPLFLAGMEGFLFYAALVVGAIALFRGEPLAERGRLNRWDSAAMLVAASMGFGLFVDEQAAIELLKQEVEGAVRP